MPKPKKPKRHLLALDKTPGNSTWVLVQLENVHDVETLPVVYITQKNELGIPVTTWISDKDDPATKLVDLSGGKKALKAKVKCYVLTSMPHEVTTVAVTTDGIVSVEITIINTTTPPTPSDPLDEDAILFP
ncbi:MAG: hypothetical protein ABL921_13445 [Pirellula sp.]